MKLVSKRYLFALLMGIVLLQHESYTNRQEFETRFTNMIHDIGITDEQLKNIIIEKIKIFFIDPLPDTSIFFTRAEPSEIELSPLWHPIEYFLHGPTKPIAAQGPSEHLLHIIKYAIIVLTKDPSYQDKQFFIDPAVTYSNNPEEYSCTKNQTLIDAIQPFFTKLPEYVTLPTSNNNQLTTKSIITIIFEHIASFLSEKCWNQLKNAIPNLSPNLNQFWLIRANGVLRKYCYYLKTTGFLKRKWQDIIRQGNIKNSLYELARAMIKLRSLSSPTSESAPFNIFVAQLDQKINRYVFDGNNKEQAENVADYITKQVRSTLSFFWHQHRIKMLITIGIGGIAGLLLYKYKRKLPTKITDESPIKKILEEIPTTTK